MRHRTGLNAAAGVLAVLAVALGSCATGDEIPDSRIRSTMAGERLLDGQLLLVDVDPPTRGREGVFLIRNVSDHELRDHRAVVLLYSPGPAGAVQQRESQVVERRFTVFRDQEIEIRVKPNRKDVMGWELRIIPEATLARDGETPGTTFLDGKIECVKVVKRLTHLEPSLSFTVENRSGKKLTLLQYKVELVKRGKVEWQTEWASFGDLAPGATALIEPDVSKVDVGAADAVLRIRQMVL